MPALPDVPKVLRVDQKFTLAGDTDVLNRQYIRFTGSQPSGGECTTYANDVYSAFDTYCMPDLTSELEHTETVVTDLTLPTANRGSFAGSSTGGSGSTYIGAGSAAVVSFKIPVRYRGGHPRNYIAGLSIDAIQNAQLLDSGWSAAFLSNFESYITAAIAAGWSGAGTLDHVYVSYYHGFTNVTYPSGRTRAVPTVRVTPTILGVNGYALNPKLCSQRRRNQSNS